MHRTSNFSISPRNTFCLCSPGNLLVIWLSHNFCTWERWESTLLAPIYQVGKRRIHCRLIGWCGWRASTTAWKFGKVISRGMASIDTSIVTNVACAQNMLQQFSLHARLISASWLIEKPKLASKLFTGIEKLRQTRSNTSLYHCILLSSPSLVYLNTLYLSSRSLLLDHTLHVGESLSIITKLYPVFYPNNFSYISITLQIYQFNSYGNILMSSSFHNLSDSIIFVDITVKFAKWQRSVTAQNLFPHNILWREKTKG